MSSRERFEQELPGLLDDLYVGPMPPYRDHVLQQAARTRQRPAWSFPGRWLPMVDIARLPVLAPRVPWRLIGFGLVLVALLVALIAALVAGGRPKLPQPFGPARNGLVAYASGGDIYTADPLTGAASAIVPGPGTDINPRWSRDGTRLAFERTADAGNVGPGLLFVAARDGSGLVQVTPQTLDDIASYTFSPDGKELLISARVGGSPGILIAETDGSGIRQLDLGMPATDPAWRPPDGSEILFMDASDAANGYYGIYAVNPAGGKPRTILARTPGRNRGYPKWSPDGSLIAYQEWSDSSDLTSQTHIIRADGSGDRVLALPPGAVWQAAHAWSNDGTRLIAVRGYSGDFTQTRPVAIPVDGSGFGVEIRYPGTIQGACCSAEEWAPDDSSILETPVDASGAFVDQILLDPVAGTYQPAPWVSASQPSWQRLAP